MTCAGRFDWTTYSTQFIACVLSICLFILPPILTESEVLGLFVVVFFATNKLDYDYDYDCYV